MRNDLFGKYLKFFFQPAHDYQLVVPAALKLACHKAIVGINGIILTTCMVRFEPRLLQRQFDLASLFDSLTRPLLDGVQSGLDADRLKKSTIVALARKLLVVLWKYVNAGGVIEGAVMKAA